MFHFRVESRLWRASSISVPFDADVALHHQEQQGGVKKYEAGSVILLLTRNWDITL